MATGTTVEPVAPLSFRGWTRKANSYTRAETLCICQNDKDPERIGYKGWLLSDFRARLGEISIWQGLDAQVLERISGEEE
ncbi:MAG: hypothetical protein A3J28_02785 [Acidobacteria bacterium RIFCSPLOWO2_12_FULL_60_22]|nr:MAG: hypothetical protein A3J28_02785 [Acidobacteria bacterium RIFCSPLOWO2_12_FULL_60_22]